MRLDVLGQPRGPLQRVMFWQIKKQFGWVPGPIAVHSYRRKLYGKHFSRAIHEAMLGIKFWNLHEAELFGTFISKHNECTFCTDSHALVAATASGDNAWVRSVLDDWQSAPIPEHLRATLTLLQKLTLTPADVTRVDLDKVRAAGVTDEGIREALYVLFCFSVMNRLADALDFDLHDDDGLTAGASIILRRGYRFVSIPG